MIFNQDELINAIRAAAKDEGGTPNSVTSTELADALGVGKAKARDLLKAAINAGVLQPGLVYRTPLLTGVRTKVTGYVLVDRGE